MRHPQYFQAGLPYIDRVEMLVAEDNASRMSAFLSGTYDLGWDLSGAIARTDWMQIKDTLKQRRPDATFEGVGVLNPAIPAAFRDWSLPVAELGDGRPSSIPTTTSTARTTRTS